MEAVAASLVEALPGHAVLLDANGTIVAANTRWRHFGVCQSFNDPAAGVGMNYLDVCDAATGADTADANTVRNGIRGVLDARLSRFAHFYPCFTPTDQRWFEVLVHPITSSTVIGAAVAHVDASGRMPGVDGALVRQAETMEAIGRLAGGLAHDFNNLLTALIGFTDLALGRPGLPIDARCDLEEVRKAADHAAALTSQLLALSRRHPRQAHSTRLNDVVRQVDPLIRRLVGERVDTTVRLAPDLPLVRVEPGQVEQVLLNLIANARDAMPDGGRLLIETGVAHVSGGLTASAPRAEAGTYVTLAVGDSGQAIDERTREHLFEPFYTGRPSGKSAGLGLAVVYGVVRQYSGFIDVSSPPDQGATFRVYLPAHDGDDAAEPLPVKASSRVATETILLAEDQDPVRALARLILEQHGYRVHVARDGADGLAVAEPLPAIDLLLTDVVMPHLTGPQLAARLAEQRPGLRVLFMSGYVGEPGGSAIAVPAGATLLRKPFTPAALLDAVRRMLDEGAAQASAR
jgi:signal transduction histidine kinase/ActR/RegA family two-component response regulator